MRLRKWSGHETEENTLSRHETKGMVWVRDWGDGLGMRLRRQSGYETEEIVWVRD